MKIDDIIGEIDTAKKKKNPKAEVLNWIQCAAIAVILVVIMTLFIFAFVRVEGESMTHTLEDGERLFVDRVTYVFSEPQRGDVVILHYPNRDNSERFVKRIIAVAGDTVAVQDGYVVLNGERLHESYTRCGDGGIKYTMSEITIPEGYVFVLGDNRNDSNDSHIIGPVSKDKLIGKALFVLWPISEWRNVD